MGNRAEVSIWVRMKDQTARVRRGLRTGIDKIKSAVFSLRTGIIALGGAMVLRAVGKLTSAFGKQQDAIISLNATLRNTGRYSDEVSQKIQRNASDLQKLTRHGDEVIIQSTAALGALAQELSGPALMQAQQAIIGIADTFMGGDLTNAALMIGKTLSSTTNALTRYGIQVDVNATQEEKLNQVLDQSIVFFENSKAAADGLTGAKVQLGNALGDTKELFGQVIAEVFGFEEGMEKATDKVTSFNEKLQGGIEKVVGWGKVVLEAGKAILKTLGGVVAGAFELGKGIGHLLRATFHSAVGQIMWLANQAIGALNWVIRGVNKVTGLNLGELGTLDADRQFAAMNSALDDAAQSGANLVGTLQDIGDAWLRLLAAADEASAAQNRALDAGAGADSNVVTPSRLRNRDVEGYWDEPEGMRPNMPVPAAEGGEYVPPDIEFSGTWEFAEGLEESLGLAGDLDDLLLHMTGQTIEGFASAIEGAFAAMASGSKTAGEAFKDGMLGAVSAVAGGLGRLYIGEATAEFAKALSPEGWPTAGAHIASAMKYMAAAGLMFALGGSAQGTARGGAGGGGGSQAAARHTESMAGESRGEATIIIEGGLLDMSDPRQQDALARALSNLSDRRITIIGG